MNGSRSLCSVVMVVVAILAFAGDSAAENAAPQPVSPGEVARFAPVGSACPTFSWSAVAGATGYEVVVYAADDGVRGVARESPEPVLRTRIPGGAVSWTPSADRCLSLSDSYLWFVRAVGEVEVGGWSEARLFKVASTPELTEIGGAIERALQRYLEAKGVPLEVDGELASFIAEEMAAAADSPAPAQSPPSPGVRYSGGKRLALGEPVERGVFGEDVELWLEETASGGSDKVQIVFATPEFDGQGLADAWAIVVNAEDTAGSDDGTMFFSTPSFVDALQLFTDGSAIVGEQREMTLRRLSSPPATCSSLQEGMFYWDEQANALCVCDGSSWDTVDADNGGTCS